MKIKTALLAIGLALTSLGPVAASAHGYGYRGGGRSGGFGHGYGARGGGGHGYGYGRSVFAYRRPYAGYGYRGYGYAPRAWAAPGCFVNPYGQVQCPQPFYGGYGYNNYGW